MSTEAVSTSSCTACRNSHSSIRSRSSQHWALEGRKVILSFGLLGPGKGYELALAALPDVVAAHPSVLYVVVGATHPDLLRSQGEAYREGSSEQRPDWGSRITFDSSIGTSGGPS